MQIEIKIKYAALLVFIATAYFSVGHYHSDEFFQILEFAQFKLGQTSAADLPWEFHEKMRPTIQPWIAVVAIKALHFINISNPFTITLLLRIISAIFFWFVICKLNEVICKKYFPDIKWTIFYYTISLFLWFVPFLSVRFSSENYSAAFLLLGLYFVIKDNIARKDFLLTGLFLGLSVLFRYQLGISVLGIFLWIMIRSKTPFSIYAYSLISFALTISLGFYLDYLFYNEFVLAPINYLNFNLIQGRAEEFGTSPWWYYISYFLIAAIPPLSIVLLASFLNGLVKLKDNVFIWGILPFLLVHFFIGHKEIRFLFPILYLFIFIATYGLMNYFSHRPIKKYQYILLKVSIGLNLILLLFTMFRPANEMVSNYKYLYDNIHLGNRTVLSIKEDTYTLDGLKTTFYTPIYCTSDHLGSERELGIYLDTNRIDKCFLVYGKFDFEGTIEGYDIEKVYSVYPSWLKTLEWIDWQEALSTHSVFLLTRKLPFNSSTQQTIGTDSHTKVKFNKSHFI